MHSSIAVANRLLELARAAGATLTPMQLIKLVFMCHGWMLGLYGRPLIREEIQAWKFGPVIPELYEAVRNFRNRPVEGQIASKDTRQLAPWEDDLIQQVFTLYGKLDGVTLSNITHEQGSPWDQVWEQGSRHSVIPNHLIETYYAQLARQASAH